MYLACIFYEIDEQRWCKTTNFYWREVSWWSYSYISCLLIWITNIRTIRNDKSWLPISSLFKSWICTLHPFHGYINAPSLNSRNRIFIWKQTMSRWIWNSKLISFNLLALSYSIIPQSTITQSSLNLPSLLPCYDNILVITSKFSTTCPKTTWFSSNQGAGLTVIKNWELLVFFPQLAIEIIPGLSCLNKKFSSSKVFP